MKIRQIEKYHRFVSSPIVAMILFFMLFTLPSCEDDPIAAGGSKIRLTKKVELSCELGSQGVVDLHCSNNWKIKLTANWLSVSHKAGLAGDYDIIVTARSANKSFSSRKAYIIVGAGINRDSVEVVQRPDVCLRVDEPYCMIPSESGSISVCCELNTESVIDVVGSEKWLTAAMKDWNGTKGEISVSYEANKTKASRTAMVFIFQKNKNQRKLLQTLPVIQQGEGSSASAYKSADYSADGNVVCLQKSAIGTGLPIVIMGDGFRDTDVANGYFAEVVDVAVENIFSEEPLKSLRQCFDIYAVTAVSETNGFGTGHTALGCFFEGGRSTHVKGDGDKIDRYLSLVPGLNIGDALAVVLLNTPMYAGTTVYGFADATGKGLMHRAVAFCPVIDSLRSENFRTVLCHEAVGHGFAKLQDEYEDSSHGAIDASGRELLDYFHKNKWAQNVDYHASDTIVLWHRFLSDDDYLQEDLGIYEGAALYPKGVYRPSAESMMRSNNEAFNAPSRWAIYYFVVSRAMGYEPDYEEFVQFDKLHKPHFRTLKSAELSRPFAPPVFVGR